MMYLDSDFPRLRREPVFVELWRVIMLSKYAGLVRSLVWSVCCALCFAGGFVWGVSGSAQAEARATSEAYSHGYDTGYSVGYDEGYSDGFVAGSSKKATKAYNDGLLEGARQILELYAAEGDSALRPQIRLLRGQAPQGK